ncbi:hypothetical protein E4U60_007518 [Claviceps pazoutovae]|uniref:Uncharacterized protein n=1 Tax=Claviceps pazoutovae TaxID=1649127 RepID=A0A9P7SI05_9HYPO|nr:hypothetical protein E4U60_007518 [Claviceps pazoutovae]
MDDAISWRVAAISVLRQSICSTSSGLSPTRFRSTVESHSPSRASEKGERFERKGVCDAGQRGLRQSLSSRGTDPNVAHAERERPVARDEHIPVLERALSDEVVGEQTFYPTAVCADCLEGVEIRHCRHHGRGCFFLARGNGEASKCSEFDSLEQW